MLARWWNHPRFERARPGIVDSVVPVLLFSLLSSWLGCSEVLALSAGVLFLAARVLATMVRQRKADRFQLFLLGLSAVSLVLAALSDDPRIVLARHSVVSLAIAVGCVATTFSGKPLLRVLLQPTFEVFAPHHGPAWDRCWDHDGAFRQRVRVLNFLVGATIAASAASRLYVVYHTSTGVALVVGGLPSLAVWAMASPVLLRVGRPAFRAMRSAHASLNI